MGDADKPTPPVLCRAPRVDTVTDDLLERLGVEVPVVQAGMGGGAAGAELAGAVSAAGALGTVGIMAPPAFGEALAEARRIAAGRPVSANLLRPFVRRAHVEACIARRVAVVVFHDGWPQRWVRMLRDAGIPVLATVGSAAAAREALAAGVDGFVAQGVEAGGHVVAQERLETVLPAVLEVADGRPVLAAGGVADAGDVRRLLDEGATAAVAGTRFLLTRESGAHPGYKARVAGADTTLLTELFALGWPLPHRVVANDATRRWCAHDERGPGWLRRVEARTGPVGRATPLSALRTMMALQRPAVPLFGPGLPLAGMPDASLERTALYAGETVSRLGDVLGADEAVAALTP